MAKERGHSTSTGSLALADQGKNDRGNANSDQYEWVKSKPVAEKEAQKKAHESQREAAQKRREYENEERKQFEEASREQQKHCSRRRREPGAG